MARGWALERLRLTAEAQRSLIVAALVVGTAIKVWWAATTSGSNDVHHFQDFARGVQQFGVYGIYGHHIIAPPYNHPPLTGWILLVLGWLSHHGMPFRLLIRLPATFADIITTILVYKLIRARRPAHEATLAAVMLALSPVLLVISGFHGNTDPIFVMFAVLSFYLLVTDRPAILAGVCFGAAVSLKLVPVVVLPVLLLVALRSGVRRLAAFVAGAGVVFVLLWVPAILLNWGPFKQNVLEYAGYGGRPRWGLPEIGHVLVISKHHMDLLEGPGRLVVLMVSAGIPLLVAWLRPRATVPAFGMTLALFLVGTTASATQYLAWAVAGAFLINVWTGTVYSLAAGALLVKIYDRWNSADPWNWDNARASHWTHRETVMAGVVWLILVWVVLEGLWRSLRPGDPDPDRSGGPTGQTQCQHTSATVPAGTSA